MKCYLCDEESTSVEHSPAKSFFPTDKRINLVTVPSCTKHNQDTSLDDEYVRNLITMSLGNNDTGIKHFSNKGLRSLTKSPKLLSAVTKNKKRIYVAEADTTKLNPSLAFEIDRARFERLIRKTAYGSFYAKFKQTWNRELIIGTEYLRTDKLKADEIGELLSSAKQYEPLISYEGNNPEVFKYSFRQTNSTDINKQILIMKYYEGFEVWAVPRQDTNSPSLD